ncbi:MAG: 23S rRNA (adenine(2030)-N(6))-methyltransferase RlmJ [Lysobacterales bacterium]
MNYRHIYHAGNFADAVKHAVLVALIEQLKHKQTPLCYLDTHAGAGSYDANDPAALKGLEFGTGIRPLLGAHQLPPALHVFLNLVRSFNSQAGGALQHYPGSPLLAASLLRPQDRVVLCELQAAEAAELRRLFHTDKRVHVHCRDGYEALGALLPPKERRGLVLIDPPFETQEQEYDTIVRQLHLAWQRWPTGVYAIWYPIKLRQTIGRFHRRLQDTGMTRMLVGELCLHPDDSALRLNGCGMLLVNPPWRFEQTLAEILDALLAHLGQGRYARRSVEWLVGEKPAPRPVGARRRAAPANPAPRPPKRRVPRS